MQKQNNKKLRFDVVASFGKEVEQPKEITELLASSSTSSALKNILPKIKDNNKPIMQPVSFDGFVANKLNKNGHGISGEKAISIASDFIHTPIDIEHDRSKVFGFILATSFSDYETGEEITEEQAKEYKDKPFNVSFAGIIWKHVKGGESLVDILVEDSEKIENVSDRKVSASWEIAFEESRYVIIDSDESNYSKAEFVEKDSPLYAEIEKVITIGKKGEISGSFRGKAIGLDVFNDIYPLGFGLTLSPAGNVKGTQTVNESDENNEIVANEENLTTIDDEQTPESNSQEYKKIVKDFFVKFFNSNCVKASIDTNQKQEISKTEEKSVTSNKSIKNIMIKTFKDINDENIKTLQASDVSELIQDEIKRVSEDYAAKIKAEQEFAASQKEAAEKLKIQCDELKASNEQIQNEFAALKSKVEEKEKLEIFSSRMESLDNEYDLDSEIRKVIASEIKDLDDDGFQSYKTKIAVLLKGKEKQASIKTEENNKEEDSSVKNAQASQDGKEKQVLDDVMKTGKVFANIPNASLLGTEEELTKIMKAFEFNKSNFIIK